MAVGPGTQARVTFRFYAELNDFLPPPRRQVAFEHVLEGPASVKDTIEALGVPHTELDLILANGESVDFSYRLSDGDRIAAYPVFESLDITPLLRVRPEPLRGVRQGLLEGRALRALGRPGGGGRGERPRVG